MLARRTAVRLFSAYRMPDFESLAKRARRCVRHRRKSLPLQSGHTTAAAVIMQFQSTGDGCGRNRFFNRGFDRDVSVVEDLQARGLQPGALSARIRSVGRVSHRERHSGVRRMAESAARTIGITSWKTLRCGSFFSGCSKYSQWPASPLSFAKRTIRRGGRSSVSCRS
jgi:hypothetical protein